MSFNNAVTDWSGKVRGYRCDECGCVFDRMWGTTCNGCREKERRHKELIAAIKSQQSNGDKNDLV